MRSSGLWSISSIKLDYRKDIQSVKWAWSVLHSELNAHVLLPPYTYIFSSLLFSFLLICYLFVEVFLKNFEFQVLNSFWCHQIVRETAFSHPKEELTQELDVDIKWIFGTVKKLTLVEIKTCTSMHFYMTLR